jgi:hypothetical protein
VALTITEQRYGPTTGTFSGWLGLVICAGSIAVLLVEPTHGTVRFALALGVVALLIWCFVLRPRIIVRHPNTLVLRNAVSTWELPLAGVSRVGVKAITRVQVGEMAYDGIAVGRRVRTMVRGQFTRDGVGFGSLGRTVVETPQPDRRPGNPSSPEAIADLVTEQVLAAAERARDEGHESGSVRRRWAWPELVLLAAAVLGFVATFLT